MANGIGITRGIDTWRFQSNYVEREMDNAAYSAAHPDDTLVLAGPARVASAFNGAGTQAAVQSGTDQKNSMLAIGMLQNMQFTQTKPTQPMMALGSGRSFFVSGKAQTQWTIARLFVNGRNLLRVLYHNAITTGGIDVSTFDDPAAQNNSSQFFMNLDSELYYVPFGLCTFFRNKSHDLIGAFYVELCMINSYAINASAGQNMILENVSGLADRIIPLDATTVATGGGRVPRSTVDAILDFSSPPEGQTINTDNAAAVPASLG